MIGGTVNKIVNTQFKWSGAEQGRTAMQGLAVGAAAIAAAAAAAGAALWRLADQTTQVFGHFDNLSAQTGVAASQLHALDIAAQETGTDFEALLMGFRRMPRFIQDVDEGLATATRSLDTLGLSMDDLRGKSIEDQFYTIADAISTVEDESTRAALAQDVFGRSGMSLVPFLERGSEDLRGLADAAREAGMVLDDEAYAAADRFQDALVRMRAEMQSTIMDAIEPMLPDLLEMAETLQDIAVEALPTLLEAAERLVPALGEVAGAVGNIVQNLVNMQANIDYLLGLVIGGGDEESWTPDPSLMSRDEYRALLGRDRLAIEEERAAKEAEYRDALRDELTTLGGSGGGGGGSGGGGGGITEALEKHVELIMEARDVTADLVAERMRLRDEILAKERDLEEEQAAALAESQAAAMEEQLARLQTYADFTEQIVGAAWDSLFSRTRQDFGDMLKDMLLDLAKSGLLRFLKGAVTGGAGFLI